MSFWCIYKSPLILGGNLPENRELENDLITNEEVLAVNQNGENPTQLYKKGGSMVWISHIPGSKDVYVGLFNIADKSHGVSVDLSQLGVKGKVVIRDLWQKKDLGKFKKRYSQMINAHGCALLRIKTSQRHKRF